MQRLRIVSAAAALLFALVGCGSQSESANDDQTRGETRPGSAAVYQRIESLTDCDALQAEFDQADANTQREQDAGNAAMAEVTISYMDAADKRMKELGCYG
jgi:hypothetical protein